MKNLVIIMSLIFCCNYSSGQDTTYIRIPGWGLPYEISSMDRKGDTLYLLSEACELLFLYDIAKDNVTSIKLNLGNVDVEGVCVFENYLFFTNESDNTIHVLDLKTKKELEVKTQFKAKQNNDLESGLEGIEITPDGKTLYVLREKSTEDSQGYLYCFNVSISNRVCKLDLVQDFPNGKITLKLPQDHRYTGLDLSSNNEVLYLLRTKKGEYYIDRMILNEKRLPEKNVYKKKDFATLDISAIVNDKEDEFNTNVEGIATSKDGFFLVSDNLMSNQNYCPGSGKTRDDIKETLFLKIQF